MKMKLPLPKPPIKKAQAISNPQKNIGNINKKLEVASKGFHAAIAKNDFQEAYKHILVAHKLVPNHAGVLMDMAFSDLKMRNYERSYQHYLQAIASSGASVNPNIYDGLAEVCHFLGKKDELIKYGSLALESKKEWVKDQAILHEISTQAPAFNPNNPKENIIAYSLFGGLPRYCETAILNMDLVKEIYPEWTCRFYVDATVPLNIRERLIQEGAEVVQVSPEQAQLSGLFWRFLIMDDPNVNCFLVRDADSLVSYRERAAVDEWLNSGKWFHCMHDSYSHTELILAGMWGGFNGVFTHLETHIQNYIATGKYPAKRVMDQHYLRYCIWPTLTQSVLIHDSQQFEATGLAFPKHKMNKDYEVLAGFHVGMDEGSAQIYADLTIPAVKSVDWTLVDEQNNAVCRYTSTVLSGNKILVELPRTYARKLESKAWKLFMYPTENTD